MKRIIEKKIVDSDKLENVSERMSHYSRSGNAIGKKTILCDDTAETYYQMTEGWGDIYAPGDEIKKIGTMDDLIDLVENSRWANDGEIVEYIENKLNKKENPDNA